MLKKLAFMSELLGISMKKLAIIREEDGQYKLYSHEGKVLRTHPSREAAIKQEQAIEISKHRRG